MRFFTIALPSYPLWSQEDFGEIAMALGDHRNAFRRQAGVKGPSDKLSGILVSVEPRHREEGNNLPQEGFMREEKQRNRKAFS